MEELSRSPHNGREAERERETGRQQRQRQKIGTRTKYIFPGQAPGNLQPGPLPIMPLYFKSIKGLIH
jgi:hypothetical protein